jgi:hypothetical protein
MRMVAALLHAAGKSGWLPLGLVGAAGLLGLVGASIVLWVETVRLIGA